MYKKTLEIMRNIYLLIVTQSFYLLHLHYVIEVQIHTTTIKVAHISIVLYYNL